MKLSKLVLSLVFTIAFLIGGGKITAQNKANAQTVTDYYLLLTVDKLPVLESVKDRRALIKTQDLKNGYLRLEGDWEGWAEIALFRKANREEAVIAVEEVGCGPECSGTAQFLTYKNGKWSDVTAQVMPQFDDEDILAAYNRVKTKDAEEHMLDDMPSVYWQLPQKGTTVKLLLGDESESNGKTLLRFTWNGERFVKATN